MLPRPNLAVFAETSAHQSHDIPQPLQQRFAAIRRELGRACELGMERSDGRYRLNTGDSPLRDAPPAHAGWGVLLFCRSQIIFGAYGL